MDKDTKLTEKIKEIKVSAEELKKINNIKIERIEENKITSILEKDTVSSEMDLSKLNMIGVPIMGTIQRASNGLFTIQGMRIDHVTLLREVGINSVHDLSIQNPDILYKKILNRGRPHERNSDWIPTKGMIVRWIRLANKN